MAENPASQQSICEYCLICAMAFMVRSLAVGSLKVMISIVESPLYSMSWMLSGIASLGTDRSRTESRQITLSTPSMPSICVFSFATSFSGMPLTTSISTLERLKSSPRTSCAFMLSVSFGRYDSRS